MEAAPSKELGLREILAIYRRRRKVVYGVALLLVVATALFCIFCTRRYQAIGTLQVQPESSDAMGLDTLMQASGAADAASGALDVNIAMQTQASILQSDTLALRTISDLNLEHTQDFEPTWNPFRLLLKYVSPGGPPDPPGATLENSPKRRRDALLVFSDNLNVKPVTGTRLIEIDYTNPDPKLAAAVVNRLMTALTDYNFQTRYDATNSASIWLNGQLGDLRKQTEDLQARVAQLQKDAGVYSLGTVDSQGREQAYSAVLDQLGQTTQALNLARQNRILKGAIAKAADSGNAEMLSGLAGNLSAGSSSMNSSLAVIQSLREQEAMQQSQLQQALAKYGPSYPRIAELRGAISGTDKSIKDEVARLRGRADSDFEIAGQSEDQIGKQYAEDKKAADLLNDKAIEYMIVRQEAEESRALYEQLLSRLKEAGILEGLKSSNITVVDPGRPPYKPHVPLIGIYLGIALAGGLVLGCCVGLVVDGLDNKVQSISELEDLLGQTILGVTPQYSRPKESPPSGSATAIALREPQSTFTESLRAIRTAILLARGDKPPKVILITSSIAGEGKTTFSANLGVVLALQGRRVLVVDTDLRRGTLCNSYGLRRSIGLSALLAGQESEPRIQNVEGAPTTFALLGGLAAPPNPSELLGSDAMKRWLTIWREQYDFVILDGTPVLPVTDAVILQPLADMTILLARSMKTERQQVERSYYALTRNVQHYIGVVLNGINPHDQSYYGYYGYYGYRQNAYADKENPNGEA